MSRRSTSGKGKNTVLRDKVRDFIISLIFLLYHFVREIWPLSDFFNSTDECESLWFIVEAEPLMMSAVLDN